MRFTISGKNIDVTDGLRTAVQDKIGKLERYFTPDTEVQVTLSVEKDRQKIEVTIPVKGNIIRSEQVSNDMYVSIDLVEEIIERQLKKYKNKIVVERAFPYAITEELVRKGHDISVEPESIDFGRGQMILRQKDGVFAGATEPRADGTVAVW